MDISQAQEELSFHSGRNSNIEDVRWEQGFLGSLRPYKGMDLIEENFHSVIKCLRVLFTFIQTNDVIDKDLVSDINGILCLGRTLAVYEEGMLLRNKIISNEEAQKIDDWLHCISYVWTMSLDSQDEEVAFEEYDQLYEI
jgi:hypothetical protein